MKSVVLVFWASAPPCHHSALSSHASLGWQGHALYRWIDVSGSGKGVTVSYPQGGLFEIGEMVNEEQVNHGYKKWKSVYKDDDTLHVYLMNNYWHTNYKAEVEKKYPIIYKPNNWAFFIPMPSRRSTYDLRLFQDTCPPQLDPAPAVQP